MPGRRRGPRAAPAAAAVLLAAAALAGCATIPTSGPVQQGPQIGADREDQFVRVIARPPLPGMTPAQLVRGFLDASASFDDGHAVARQYLTEAARQGWDPSTGVRVYGNAGLGIAQPADGRVRVAAALDGAVSAAGRYSVAAPGAQVRADFAVVQEDGEWRISGLADGLLLSASDVARAFRTYDVYFFDPTFSVLVPDPRTVPVLGPGLATTLVQRLLDGPTTWLAPAVATALPEGTGLALASVPVDAGVARVDLTTEVLGADDRTRRALSAQLVWTLRQLPDIAAVELTVAGAPLDVPGATSPQAQDAWPSVDPSGFSSAPGAYAVDVRGRLVQLVAGEARAAAGPVGRGSPSVTRPAVSLDETTVAAIGRDGRTLWTGPLRTGVLTRRFAGSDLTRPSVDRTGAVWVVDRATGVRVLRPDGSVARVGVDGLAKGARVVDVAVARDGTRAAVVVARDGRAGLLLVRVDRRGDALRLAAPRRAERRLTGVLDVAWSGADRVAVLGTDGAGPVQVFDVDLAQGEVRALGAPEDPRALAAAPDQPTLVAAADGVLYAPGGGSWVARARATAPAYPG